MTDFQEILLFFQHNLSLGFPDGAGQRGYLKSGASVYLRSGERSNS